MMKFFNNRGLGQHGFTLIELMVVMSIMGILAAIAVPSYLKHQLKARETVLSEDLYQMRRSLDGFYADKGHYPDTLEDLISGHYLRGLPRDPFTGASDTWKCVPPEPTENGDFVEGGCFDIKSGSDQIGQNGTPYNQW
ncbi:prepilin-type N-terminal cleavage/methylation domain-containing protein [Geopsychrobacter electrodiphilus]|uniref:prepilin-type N-terminal cleavage/methylation domain-containing protein n=1 Tax=Geopsychrobacter electrodiphilus TaxID=225196 RepID=UPI00047707B8|nr:prepilin-type N-terminal cleavage/methylation domain-containing protein [Geopsychrobacter electrodiphilus]